MKLACANVARIARYAADGLRRRIDEADLPDKCMTTRSWRQKCPVFERPGGGQIVLVTTACI